MNKKHRFGFTLIEILVAVTIIGLLATAGSVAYGSVAKQSRDARRKADLEQIRSALEMYRSNNGAYPPDISAGITDASNTYLSKLPTDPKSDSYAYHYEYISSGSDYVIGSYLEQDGSTTCSVSYSCASGGSGPLGFGPGVSANCNYCLGPYGPK